MVLDIRVFPIFVYNFSEFTEFSETSVHIVTVGAVIFFGAPTVTMYNLNIVVLLSLLIGFEQQSRRRKPIGFTAEYSHFYMKLLRHRQLPETSTPQRSSQQSVDPSSSEQLSDPTQTLPDVLSTAQDVITAPTEYPHHYITPLPGRESGDSGYEVPACHDRCAGQRRLDQEIENNADIYDHIRDSQI